MMMSRSVLIPLKIDWSDAFLINPLKCLQYNFWFEYNEVASMRMLLGTSGGPTSGYDYVSPDKANSCSLVLAGEFEKGLHHTRDMLFAVETDLRNRHLVPRSGQHKKKSFHGCASVAYKADCLSAGFLLRQSTNKKTRQSRRKLCQLCLLRE